MLEKMRELRRQKGLSMKQVGEIVGVGEGAISTYETGRSEPSLSVLCAIADVLDCSLDLLVRGKEKDHSEEWSRQEKPIDTVEIKSALETYDGLSRAAKKAFWSNIIKWAVQTDDSISFEVNYT